MKKIIPLALIMFVLMIAGAWSIGWYLQAREIKKMFSGAITIVDPSIGTITAGTVTTSGFPSKMVVTLENPKISFKTNKLLSYLHKQAETPPAADGKKPRTVHYRAATLEYELNGTAVFSVNMLSDQFDVVYTGSDITRIVRPKITYSYVTDYNAPVRCSARMTKGKLLGQMWDMQKFLNPEYLMNNLRSASCNIPGSTTSDMNSNQILTSLDSAHFSFSLEPSPDRHNSQAIINLKNFEVLPAGDAMYNEFASLSVPYGKPFFPFSMSLFGRQSMDFDFAADVPKTMQTPQPARIEFKKLAFSSAAGTMNGNFLFSTNPKDGYDQGELSFNFISQFAPLQTQIARQQVNQFMAEAMQDRDFVIMHKGKDMTLLSNSAFEALPNVTAMGTLTQKLRMGYSADRITRQGSFNIAEMEFTSRDYGILGNGQGSIVQGNAIPTVDANITCKNCIATIDTLANYLRRLDAFLVQFAPQKAGIAIPPQELAGLKGVLSVVGIPAATGAGDLQFTVKSGATSANVNGKSLEELMAIYSRYAATVPAN